MTEGNGVVKSLREVIEEGVLLGNSAPADLLRDMEQQLPFLRLFLCGGPRHNHSWPPGTVKLEVVSGMLRARMHVAALEVQSDVLEMSWDTLLQVMENRLQTDTVPWQQDWRSRQRTERKLMA